MTFATSSNGKYPRCLDITNLRPITVPHNVTRIGTGGLAVCLPTGQPPSGNIVYVVDVSESMAPDAIYISTNQQGQKDTLWLSQGLPGSPSSTYSLNYNGQNRPIAVYVEAADARSRDSVFYRLSQGQVFLAGDPYGARNSYVRKAISIQKNLAPTSTAGFVTFSDRMYYKSSQMSFMNDTTALLAAIDANARDVKFSTNYGTGLQGAVDLLATVPGNKSIIFISDGAPSDPENTYLGVLRQAGYHGSIHTIYLGATNGEPNVKLAQLASYDSLLYGSKTSTGAFSQVDPKDTVLLNQVLSAAVEGSITYDKPRSIRITNRQNTQTSTSAAAPTTVQMVPDQFNRYRFDLDQIVGLLPGDNKIDFDFGAATPTRVTIHRQLATEAQQNISDTTYKTSCFDPSMLILRTAPDSAQPSYLTIGNDKLYLHLTTAASGLDTAAVQLYSTRQGEDSVTARLPSTSDDSVQIFTNVTPVALTITDPPKIPGNTTLEAFFRDTVRANWCHPRDPSDCASLKIRVKNSVVAEFENSLPGIVTGRDFPTSKALGQNPVIIMDSTNTVCLTCDPGSSSSWQGIPNIDTTYGPTFAIKIQFAFAYQAVVFDHLGKWVNSFSGGVDSATIEKARALPGRVPRANPREDMVTMRLTFVPVSADGNRLGTGVYIFKFLFKSSGTVATDDEVMVNDTEAYTINVGYIRK